MSVQTRVTQHKQRRRRLSHSGTMNALWVLCCSLFAIPSAFNLRKCSKSPSLDYAGEFDVHCSCMQHLLEFDELISSLTINQTGCEGASRVLRLNWKVLQEVTGVKKVTFDDAAVVFMDAEDVGKSSVLSVTFLNSFLRISTNAFKGLNDVESLHLVNCRVESIEKEAFSGFQRLETIEFVFSNVTRVEANAFHNLPAIQELAFLETRIDLLEQNAISIAGDFEGCSRPHTTGRSISSSSSSNMSRFMGEIEGRALSFFSDINLPKEGSKLLIFLSTIGKMESESVNTSAFSYVILGGNDVGDIEGGAFKVTTQSNCEINAILLIGNFFRKIKSEAFLGVAGESSGGRGANPLFAIADDTFQEVSPGGFAIDPRIESLYVGGNKFTCDCASFDWVFSEELSHNHKRLKKELIQTGNCSTGREDLKNFLKNCPEVPNISENSQLATTALPQMDTMPSSAFAWRQGRESSSIAAAAFAFTLILTAKV